MKRQKVSRVLKRHGIKTSYVRSREGFRISQSGDEVRLSADFDSDTEAKLAADALEQICRDAGFTVRRKTANSMYIS